MFDPERDTDPGPRRFYLRLLAVVVISVAGCTALAPSVISFSVGVNDERGCLAIKDGWHADRKGPTKTEQATVDAGYQGSEPPPALVPLLDRVYGYETWRDGPGACIPESRHRLMLSGFGLGALAVICGGIAIVRRTRTNLRRSRAEHEDVDAGSVGNEVLV